MSAGSAPARAPVGTPPTASTLAPRRWTREASVDFFRGLGLWMIFIDHLDPNIWSHLSLWRVGFSDFAEIFVFLSGFINVGSWERAVSSGQLAIVFKKLVRRISRLYVAHVVSLATSIAVLAFFAARGLRINDPSMYTWMAAPAQYGWRILTLNYAPHLFSLLLLYLVIAPVLPLAIFGLKRAPIITLCFSGGLWCLSQFPWFQSWVVNLNWSFQPLAWQFLFVLGAAVRYFSDRLGPIARSRWMIAAATALVAGSAALKCFTLFPWTLHLLTPRLHAILMRDSGKSELEPYRLVHFLALLALAHAFLLWRDGWLQSFVARLASACGADSLFIYACSLVLVTSGNLILPGTHAGAVVQLLVSVSGVGAMCALAWMRRPRTAGL